MMVIGLVVMLAPGVFLWIDFGGVFVEQKNLDTVILMNQKLGDRAQLVNFSCDCAFMQLLVSRLLRGESLPREVFVDGLSGLYVMLNAMVLAYGLASGELEAAASSRLEGFRKSLELVPSGDPAVPPGDPDSVPGSDVPVS